MGRFTGTQAAFSAGVVHFKLEADLIGKLRGIARHYESIARQIARLILFL